MKKILKKNGVREKDTETVFVRLTFKKKVVKKMHMEQSK